MVIRMANASKILAKRVAKHFLSQGLNVFVEIEKSRISLAVFNLENELDHFSINGLVGIATISEGNKYFITHREKFVSAEICFAELFSLPI